MAKAEEHQYRTDIDGLRAIAVLAVIAFHYGFLKNGYLGVDVFFVVSGFLITGIIKRELDDGRFSIVNFYLRRTRRIVPLALFITAVALGIGMLTMLPHDLHSLSENVVATNFFANNVLQVVAINNYWDVWNDYKPLMHTWSLGVEEQYYMFYPLLFLLVGKKRPALLAPAIAALAVLSLGVCFLPRFDDTHKFYIISFRFWELAVGGLLAIGLGQRLLKHKFAWLVLGLLVAVHLVGVAYPAPVVPLLITVGLTATLLASSVTGDTVANALLTNPVSVWLGKISFSLYMWHQVLVAYCRYVLIQELKPGHFVALFALTVLFSAATYQFVEQPFRNRKRVSNKLLFACLLPMFLLTTGLGFFIYRKDGVLRDVPELDISKASHAKNYQDGYNSRVFEMDKDFSDTNKLKVLVAGNSFARDWANVLMESKFKDEIEVRYVSEPEHSTTIGPRSRAAAIVFCSFAPRGQIAGYSPDMGKVWVVGTKSFGKSNGIFYNYRGPGYHQQRTSMEEGKFEENERLKGEWKDRYIDLVAKVVDANKTVPVFTSDEKFISQDCRHFTEPGAKFFATLVQPDLERILGPLLAARR